MRDFITGAQNPITNFFCFFVLGEAILITPNNGKIVAKWMTDDDLELVVFSKNPLLDLISLGIFFSFRHL